MKRTLGIRITTVGSRWWLRRWCLRASWSYSVNTLRAVVTVVATVIIMMLTAATTAATTTATLLSHSSQLAFQQCQEYFGNVQQRPPCPRWPVWPARLPRGCR